MVNLQKNVGSYDRGVRALIGIVALAVGVAGLAGVAGVGETLGTPISVVV
ncbi:MAG: YgaP-like transmembrane domain, partial [Halobacteriales archaeon]